MSVDWNKQVGVLLTDCFGLIVDEENRQRYMKLKKNTTIAFTGDIGFDKYIQLIHKYIFP